MFNLQDTTEAKKEIQNAAIERWLARADKRAETKQILLERGPGSADSPVRQIAFAKRMVEIAQINAAISDIKLPFGVERRMGPSLDWFGTAPSDQAQRAGRPVARLVPLTARNIDPVGFATGFMIAPTLLLTNWHVFPTRAHATDTAANFLYENTNQGISRGLTFALDPDSFYLSDKQLDFAIVAVSTLALTGSDLSGLGTLTLIQARPKILLGDPINIIQHPDGGPKKYATYNNRLIDIFENEGFLQYETDTLQGSSGSPAFSNAWELVGVHHSSIPETRDGNVLNRDGDIWHESMGDEAVKWIANEGIRISAIVAKLTNIKLPDTSQQMILNGLLATTSDPVPQAFMSVMTSKNESINITQEKTNDLQFNLNKENGMSGIQFNFSGPVTINITNISKPEVAESKPQIKGLEAAIRFDPDYDSRKGYDPAFLDSSGKVVVPIPSISASYDDEVYKDLEGKPLVLKYHHFELVMNRKRRLQIWSAVNIDYSPSRKTQGARDSWGSDKWIGDPRIPANLQIFDADFYKPAGNIDRGHIVRREDNEWGDDLAEIEFANSDTFHWTNCTPQHEAFNQSNPAKSDKTYAGREGIWGAFENYIQQNHKKYNSKACIIAGPIFDKDDPSADFGRGYIQYPIRFFKIISVVEGSGVDLKLKVFGFIFSQKDVVEQFGIESFDAGRFKQYQVPLSQIEGSTGLVFDQVLHEADLMNGRPAEPIGDVNQVYGLNSQS